MTSKWWFNDGKHTMEDIERVSKMKIKRDISKMNVNGDEIVYSVRGEGSAKGNLFSVIIFSRNDDHMRGYHISMRNPLAKSVTEYRVNGLSKIKEVTNILGASLDYISKISKIGINDEKKVS